MPDITSQSGSPLGEAVSTSSQPTTRRKARVRRRNGKGDTGNAGKLGAAVGKQIAGSAKGADDKLPDPYKKQINALTTEKYGSAESALQRQQARVPSAFDSYRAIISGIANRQQAQYGRQLQGLGEFGNTLAQGAQGLIAQTGQAQQQGAAVTGATPSSQVAQDAARAAIVRQGSLGSLGGLIGNQGAAEATYLGNRQASSGMAQFQAQAAADQAVADLKREKGAYKVSARGQLEQAAADAAAQAEKTQIALAIAGMNNDTDLAQSKITSQTSKANTKINANADKKADNNAVNKWGYTNKEWRGLSVDERQAVIKKQSAPTGTNKPRIKRKTDSRKVGARLDDINETWRNLRKGAEVRPNEPQEVSAGGIKVKIPTVRKPNHEELVAALEGKGYKTTEIRLARLVARKKTFSKHDMQIARNLGFIVPKDLRP